MKLTGARQTVVSGASPCGNGRPAAKRSATESPRCEGALVSRAAFDFNLRWVKSADREAALEFNMASIVYRCPMTGQKIESWLADDAPGGDRTYVVLRCSACDCVHLINRSAAGTRDGDSSPPPTRC